MISSWSLVDKEKAHGSHNEASPRSSRLLERRPAVRVWPPVTPQQGTRRNAQPGGPTPQGGLHRRRARNAPRALRDSSESEPHPQRRKTMPAGRCGGVKRPPQLRRAPSPGTGACTGLTGHGEGRGLRGKKPRDLGKPDGPAAAAGVCPPLPDPVPSASQPRHTDTLSLEAEKPR